MFLAHYYKYSNKNDLKNPKQPNKLLTSQALTCVLISANLHCYLCLLKNDPFVQNQSLPASS